MKLRINNNSIRLRLSQSEVAQIGKKKPVNEILVLSGRQVDNFEYSLVPSLKAKTVNAVFSSNKLTVTVPVDITNTWAATDQVTIRHVQGENTDTESLILIEKDFKCLHKRPGEDESDNFAHPMG